MFVKILFVTLPATFVADDYSSALSILEEELLGLWKNYIYDFSSNEFFIYNEDFINNDAITFADYNDEGKILKNFLIETGIATIDTYKNFFSLKKQEQKSEEIQPKSGDELDSLIAKVDKNDPKLLDVLMQIQKLKNKS